MSIKLLQKEFSVLVSVDGYSFDFRVSTHSVTDDGNSKVTVTSLISGDIEIYQTDISEFKDLSGVVVANNYSELLIYLSYSSGYVYIDETNPLNKYTVSVSNGELKLNLIP